MKINNYEDIKDELREFLSDYLASQGFDNLTNFHCIHPDHNDGNPSCGVLADRTHFHCLGCGITGDIFDAVHFLEGKPIGGMGFITDNLLYLGELFNVPIELAELSDEDAFKINTYNAYKKTAEIVSDFSVLREDIEAEVEKRGWNQETLAKTQTGYATVSEIQQRLTQMGYDPQFLNDIQLDRTDIFDNGRLVFTITDHHGRPVGFAARNLQYEQNKDNPKYVNFSTSGKFDIYQKGKRLFNLHNAIPAIRKGEPLYIFEGYTDVLTAVNAGLTNCCAVGGTGLTEDHVLLLRELGIHHVVLCFDGDEPGQTRVQKVLDTRFSGHKDINVKIMVVPNGDDPDNYIRENGREAFHQLAHRTAFEWRLLRFATDVDPEEICKLMIPLIVGEPSHITQEKMCGTLSEVTGVSINAIQAELTRLTDDKQRSIAQERDVILDKLNRQLKFSGSDAVSILSETLTSLHELSLKHNADNLSQEACIRLLDEQREYEEARSNEFQGFRLGDDLKALEEALSGEWKKDVLCLFGGKANSGKTSLLAKMAVEIARIPENNACVIFHTIDDTAQQFLPKWVCIAERIGLTEPKPVLRINEVRFPNYYAETDFGAQLKGKRAIGYDQIRKLMSMGRLILKDANDGNSIASAETMIRYYKEKYPDRNIVYILDNLHKLRDNQNNSDERVRFRTISERVKNLATRHHITILSTVEYTKLAPGVRPTNYNIAETVQLEYDANLAVHLYNEVHDMGEQYAANQGMTHTDEQYGKQKLLPVIEMSIGKNKISDFKNKLYFRFFPASSDFMSSETPQPVAQPQGNSSSQFNTGMFS